MNQLERFRAICNFEPVDAMPLWRFQGCVGGFYTEMVDRWREEECFPPARSSDSLLTYFGMEQPELIPSDTGMWPPFETKVLEDRGDRELVQTANGEVVLQVKDNARYCSMPHFVSAPVKDRADWVAVKERYQLDPRRYPMNWNNLVERYCRRDNVLRLGAGAGYVSGYYGHLRALLGIEHLSVMYYDDPQLIKDINQHTVDFLIETLDQCLSEVEVDMIVIGEDMAGRNGSLISPAMFREFMLPYYQRFTGFCRAHDVGSIWVDSDGDIRKLIPLFLEAGVDGVMPMDTVIGQVDVVEIREAFPQLLMAGGIDKRVVEEGRSFTEIDVELEYKVRPMLDRGGYFPGPDHAFTPQASLPNVIHYVEKMREICGLI